MRSWFLGAKESFWFLPAVLGAVSVLVAQGLVGLDRWLVDAQVHLPFFNELSASGGRSILTTIGTSMLTVAGTSFSITISVLATTSSTYGPRLVRNFLADRANQFVLAMFTATFLYCLVVLRAVRTSIEDRVSFVPTLGIHLGVLIAIVDVGVLVFFIHHIATSVQITTLLKRVQTDLVRAVDRTHPARIEQGWTDGPVIEATVAAVRTPKDGYVQQVDLDDLLRCAVEHDVRISVVAMPGDHVIAGDALVRLDALGLQREATVSEELEKAVRKAFAIGVARTPEQDLRFALQQLVEMAVRGLASGTNDPYTTVSALDLARVALVPLVERPDPPTGRLDQAGTVRLTFTWPPTAAIVGEVVDSLRQYGLEHPAVVRAGLELVGRLGDAAPDEALRRSIADRTRDLLTAYGATAPAGSDLDALSALGQQVLQRLSTDRPAARTE